MTLSSILGRGLKRTQAMEPPDSPSFIDKDVCKRSKGMTGDLRVRAVNALLPPVCLLEELPCQCFHRETIRAGRQALTDVFDGKDDRVVVIVGPCSVHDVDAALVYARQLHEMAVEYQEDLVVVMRVYFEKPRTTVGWKGLINDPDCNGTYKINKGLHTARQLLLDIAALGLPTAVEFLDTISPQYIADLVSWGAIGARTTESQVHRELASGLSMPVGFKNATSGDVKVAMDAIQSANSAHSFLSVTKQGVAAIVHTTGNPYGHIILRGDSHRCHTHKIISTLIRLYYPGGTQGINYDAASVQSTQDAMVGSGCTPWVVVDCSHGNSQKKHANQPIAASAVAKQIAAGAVLSFVTVF